LVGLFLHFQGIQPDHYPIDWHS